MNSAYTNYRQQQQAIQAMARGKRQRQEAAKQPPRLVTAPFVFQWDDTAAWHTEAGSYVVDEMTDAHLWQTVIWCVRNVVKLHKDAGGASAAYLTPACGAAQWITGKPIFRALARESIRRHFTYPNDVFIFLMAYLLDDAGALEDYRPWQDLAKSPQADALQVLEDMPLQPPVGGLGKPLRAIEIDNG